MFVWFVGFSQNPTKIYAYTSPALFLSDSEPFLHIRYNSIPFHFSENITIGDQKKSHPIPKMNFYYQEKEKNIAKISIQLLLLCIWFDIYIRFNLIETIKKQ